MPVNESIEYFPQFNPQTQTPGVSTAIGSGIAAIGTPGALDGAGAVVLYAYSPAQNGWGYVGVLTGSSIDGVEQVRSLGASCIAFGSTLVVGAQGDTNSPGRVFVLRPPYGNWSFGVVPIITELGRPQPAKGDGFGASLAHCSDGTNDYIAVGAPSAPAPPGVSSPGQAFIFHGLDASPTPWSATPITNPDPEAKDTDRFGASIAVGMSRTEAGELDGGLVLAVGAPGTDEGQGAVHVGRAGEGGNWAPLHFEDRLVPSFPGASDDFRTSDFGAAVAMTGGATLAVGSPNDPNFTDMIEGTGAVWIYNSRDGHFVAGESENRLYGQGENFGFGSSLAFAEATLSEDGSTAAAQASHLVVGAPGGTRAYRFANDPVDGSPAGVTFSLEAEYAALVGKPGDRFGVSVAASTSPDGAWCLVGGPGDAAQGSDGGGFLYVDGPAPTWLQTPGLVSTPTMKWGGMPTDWWKKWTPGIAAYLGGR